MRAVFFLLLFANLAFLAWAEWVDAPQPAPTNAAYAKLPRLKLVNELPTSDVRPSGARPSSGSARKTALEVPPPAARCVSIGPFDDQAGASRGASQLREKGLVPRERVEKGEVSKGFWVYIGGLKTDGEVTQVLHTLEESHVDDAHVMPDVGDSHRVSVGLFSERERADRRAGSIQKLGLQPEVAERKLPGTVYWMDVDVAPGRAVPTAGDALSASDGAGAGAGAGGDAAGAAGGGTAANAGAGAGTGSSAGASASAGAGANTSGGSRVTVVSCPAEPASPDSAPTPDTSTPFRTKVAGATPAPKVP